MPGRLRLALVILAAVAVAVAITLFAVVNSLLQPERFTAMLQQQARKAGLELTLASPASPTLWPTPALELQGINLRSQHAGTPMLVATRGRLVLPWRTLFGGPTAISRLELDAPRIDLDAVSAALAHLPERPAGAPPYLPEIDAGFVVTRGTLVRADDLLLRDVELDAGRLAAGRPFALRLSAVTDDDTPYKLTLATRPRLDSDSLRLDDLRLHVDSAPRFAADLAGKAQWRGGADISAQVAGKLVQPTASFDLVLAMTPANQSEPLSLALKLDGGDNHIDVRMPPLQLADWWAGATGNEALAMPPVSGNIDAADLDIGGVQVKGLRVRAGADVPAPASTAAGAPADKTP
jgi:AsmA protein